MLKINRLPRPGWFVIGVAAAALLMPSAAAAAAITFTTIQGANGNKADVSPAGQLLTSQAAPGQFFRSSQQADVSGGAVDVLSVAVPPAHKALVVTSLHVAVIQLLGGQSDGTGVNFYIAQNSSSGDCTDSFVASADALFPSVTGTTVLPFSPGMAIPAHDQLCEVVADGLSGDLINETAYVDGYTVSPGAVPAAQAKHVTPAEIRGLLAHPSRRAR
jgi:hypothetical protein